MRRLTVNFTGRASPGFFATSNIAKISFFASMETQCRLDPWVIATLIGLETLRLDAQIPATVFYSRALQFAGSPASSKRSLRRPLRPNICPLAMLLRKHYGYDLCL